MINGLAANPKRITKPDLLERTALFAENIIELFDTIVWKKNENMKLSLEFIQTDLPKKINLFNYIYMAEKMIQRNNSNTPIASFSIEFNPLFGEFQDFDRYVLYPEE